MSRIFLSMCDVKIFLTFTSPNMVLLWLLNIEQVNKGNNKITELRTILQRESQTSYVYKQTKSVHNWKTVKTIMTLTICAWLPDWQKRPLRLHKRVEGRSWYFLKRIRSWELNPFKFYLEHWFIPSRKARGIIPNRNGNIRLVT
jgi:hypothetical protein